MVAGSVIFLQGKALLQGATSKGAGQDHQSGPPLPTDPLLMFPDTSMEWSLNGRHLWQPQVVVSIKGAIAGSFEKSSGPRYREVCLVGIKEDCV